MRRTIAFLTALILCLSFAACGGTGNETHDYILHLLENGEYDMAIHVIEGLKSGKTDPAQQQQSPASNERILELVPGNTGSDWRFEMELTNDTSRHLTLEAIHITDYLNGEAGPTIRFEGDDLGILPLGRLELEPGRTEVWDDMRPLDYGFNRREYLHVFRDEQGEAFRIIHVFDMGGNMTEGPAAYDQTTNLVPETNGSDWFFHMDIVNQTEHTLTLDVVLIIDRLDDQELGTSGFEGADLNRLNLGGLVLKPGEGRGWDDGFPVRDAQFNQREYLFVFNDESGEKVRFSFPFDMRGMMPSGPSGAGAPQQPGGDWHFPITLHNTGNTPWELIAMDITNLMNGASMGTMIFEGTDLGNIGLGGLVLEPGQQQSWGDGHPAVSDWNGREYRFHFRDGNGQTQIQVFRFEDLDKQNQPVDYSQDQGKDLKTLRHDAAFEVEVSKGVCWVPAAVLGSSRYSNMDIHNMLPASPEEKQQKISTLYEALQLYQVGNFHPSDDNVRLFEGGINWEHHKPGYHAVRTNTGCCATDSNWLRYILDGDYEEVGYIATSQRDGSGHIYNYILQGGWYYIIDLTHYHASGSPMMTAEENGDLNAYHTTDYVLGNIHKVRNIQDYVDYVQRAFNDPPGLMFMYTAENCLAVDGTDTQIIYESAGQPFVRVIFDDPSDRLEFVWKASPTQLPDWNRLP